MDSFHVLDETVEFQFQSLILLSNLRMKQIAKVPDCGDTRIAQSDCFKTLRVSHSEV